MTHSCWVVSGGSPSAFLSPSASAAPATGRVERKARLLPSGEKSGLRTVSLPRVSWKDSAEARRVSQRFETRPSSSSLSPPLPIPPLTQAASVASGEIVQPVASSANTRSSTVQGSVAGCGRAAARPGPAATRKRTAASAQAAPGLAARLIAPSGLPLPVDDLHAVGIVGLEDEAAVAVLAQPAGDVLVAEEQLLVGLLGRGDEEGERHLVLRPLVVEVLVDDPRARRRRPAQHLDRRRAGLVERAAGVLAVPALQPGQ